MREGAKSPSENDHQEDQERGWEDGHEEDGDNRPRGQKTTRNNKKEMEGPSDDQDEKDEDNQGRQLQRQLVAKAKFNQGSRI